MPILHIHSPETSIDTSLLAPELTEPQLIAAMAYRNATLDVLKPGFQDIITPTCWGEEESPFGLTVVRFTMSSSEEGGYITTNQILDPHLIVPGDRHRADTPTDASPFDQKFIPQDSDFFMIRRIVPWKIQYQLGALLMYRTVPQAYRLEKAFSSPAERDAFVQNICPDIANLIE
jgi:hypothetical protein